jgi:hypothetical protein
MTISRLLFTEIFDKKAFLLLNNAPAISYGRSILQPTDKQVIASFENYHTLTFEWCFHATYHDE